MTELSDRPEKLKPGTAEAPRGQQISPLFLCVPCSVLLTFCNRFSSQVFWGGCKSAPLPVVAVVLPVFSRLMETSWRGCWFWNRGSCMIVLWELRMNHHPILTEKSRIFPELELYIWWCWATCSSTTKRLGNAQSAKQSEVKSQTTAGHETHRKIVKVLEKIFFCSLYLPFLEKQPILYNKSKIYIYI